MKGIAVVKYLFSGVGLAMIFGAFFMYSKTQNFLSEAIITEGTVTHLVLSNSSDSSTYWPVVVFKTQNGELVEFTSSVGSNPPSYTQGEIVEVYYLESFPENAKIRSFFSLWGGTTIVGGLGTIFFTIGFIIISANVLKDRKVKYLKKHGVPVVARFQSVEINDSLKVNGRSPYKIIAQWQDPSTSKVYVFSSENLWFDPTEQINRDEVTVLIERENPTKYYVDVSNLPKVGN